MRTTRFLSFILIQFTVVFAMYAQQKEFVPDLSKVKDNTIWIAHNRDVEVDNNEVFLDGKEGDGLLWLKDFNFENGIIELDIKGKDEAGRSFVGIAFHGINDSTYEAVYFRPFNFKNTERSNRSVQYISHPEFPWYRLREEYPDKYEDQVTPIPEPNNWFHVTLVVNYPKVEVYINYSTEPSLIVDQLSERKNGWVGFYVGNGSEGYFKNLKIISKLSIK